MSKDLIIKQYAVLKGGEIWEDYHKALLLRDIPDFEIEQMSAYINDLRDINLEMLLHVKIV